MMLRILMGIVMTVIMIILIKMMIKMLITIIMMTMMITVRTMIAPMMMKNNSIISSTCHRNRGQGTGFQGRAANRISRGGGKTSSGKLHKFYRNLYNAGAILIFKSLQAT